MQEKQIVPLTYFQRHRMVDAALDTETPDRFHALFSQSWAIRFKPGLSLRKVQRAFANLTQRHDMLRMRVVEYDGDWAGEILSEHAAGLVVEDHGPMSKDAQEKIVAKICAERITALDPVLFDMRLLRFGSEGDVLVGRGQHIIYDAYSVGIILVEMISYLLNIPVVGRTISHRDFIAYRDRQMTEREEEKRIYWEGSLLPKAPPLNVGRQKKGLPPIDRYNMGDTNLLEPILTPAVSAHVKQVFERTGISANAQIQAAFGDAVCALGDGTEAMWCSMLGRQDAKLAGYVGPAMMGLIIRYAAGGGAQKITDLTSRGAAHLPSAVLNPGNSLTRMNYQFFVNMPKPVGRLANSPLRKVLDIAEGDGFSLGPIQIERVPTGVGLENDMELELNIYPSADAPNAGLMSDATSWDMSELEELAATMNDLIMS
ncbi:MAG: condensation domain-containing protein [Pseudomonadota bacterium]